MNCREVRDRAPLYLSRELSGEERQSFDAHLAACPPCALELEQQALVDAGLRRALGDSLPDTARIEQTFRSSVATANARRWRIAAAASVLAAAGTIYGLVRLTAPPRAYADAARDHHAEVVERQPRHWRSVAAEIDPLATQYGLSFGQLSALAAEGYSLEHAKICGIEGHRMLHLVFTNGSRSYSLFVAPQQGTRYDIHLAGSGSEQVAGFGTGRFRALLVTADSASDCERLARLTASRL